MGLGESSIEKQDNSLKEAAGTSKPLQDDLVEVHKQMKIYP